MYYNPTYIFCCFLSSIHSMGCTLPQLKLGKLHNNLFTSWHISPGFQKLTHFNIMRDIMMLPEDNTSVITYLFLAWQCNKICNVCPYSSNIEKKLITKTLWQHGTQKYNTDTRTLSSWINRFINVSVFPTFVDRSEFHEKH